MTRRTRQLTEAEARHLKYCPACGAPKSSGPGAQLVCWGACWKGPQGFKWSPLPFGEWLTRYQMATTPGTLAYPDD